MTVLGFVTMDVIPPRDDFGRRLFRLGQSWRREVDSQMRRFGLTDATWRPLFYLGRFGDGMRQTDLAAALDIEGPSLVRLLDALEAQALLARTSDPTDRRVKNLHLTPAGQKTYRRVADAYAKIRDHLLRDVAPDDITTCLRVFDQLDRELANPTISDDNQQG